MKSKSWCIRLRGEVYANGPCSFRETATEKQMRDWARDWLKVKRLPKGTEIWATKD